MALLRIGFYEVKTSGEERRSFSTAMNNIFDLPLSEREQDVGAVNKPFIVRLERLEEDDKYIYGEITRVQHDNIPAEARDDGVVDLELEGGLAHFSAFRYHKKLGILAVQLNKSGTSMGRLAAYLEKFEEFCKYEFSPIPRENAWERFNKKSPRKLRVSMANPKNLNLSEDEERSLFGNALKMVEMYEGVSINIEISVGRQKSILNSDKVRSMISNALRLKQNHPETIQILKISSGTIDRIEDKIDFLEEILVERTDIDDLPQHTERNYKIRRDHIKTIFSENIAMLENQFGASNG